MDKSIKIKYIDRRPIYFPKLAYYPGGIALPSGDNIIEVTEKEARQLLNETNGATKKCYQKVQVARKNEAVQAPEIKQEA